MVEYLHNRHEDRHPIAVSISAGALGWPEQLRDRSQRLSGRRLEKWAVKLLRAMASRCDPWYGTVDVEYSLPTPSALKVGKASLSPQVFVSRHAGTTVLEAFDEAFAETAKTEWDSGQFYSGSTRPTRASALLGRVAT
ncbi:hypothetical protein JOF41_003468 [Saccharothrix coeruleofusca]|uniref:hypothetical protein n=1 Tax=Saccharothrix coeruleofusca TaxID=33919 RepID=UPI001AE7DFD0|nr:hypothetical protein [Saccharothrix coeruleofusca]MBP2337290.1 hypothetical protein [Saccharothrix coeruleofusca]